MDSLISLFCLQLRQKYTRHQVWTSVENSYIFLWVLVSGVCTFWGFFLSLFVILPKALFQGEFMGTLGIVAQSFSFFRCNLMKNRTNASSAHWPKDAFSKPVKSDCKRTRTFYLHCNKANQWALRFLFSFQKEFLSQKKKTRKKQQLQLTSPAAKPLLFVRKFKRAFFLIFVALALLRIYGHCVRCTRKLSDDCPGNHYAASVSSVHLYKPPVSLPEYTKTTKHSLPLLTSMSNFLLYRHHTSGVTKPVT